MGGKRLRGRVVPRLTDTEDPLPSYRRGSGSVAPAGCLRRIPTGALPVPRQKKTRLRMLTAKYRRPQKRLCRHNVAVCHRRETQT
jgi:hypothetical protein